MNVKNLLRIALKALQRNKLRAFLTMLGIIIGVAAVITMVSIGEGSKQSIQDQLSSMGSNIVMIRPNSGTSGGVRLDNSNVQTLTLQDVSALRSQARYLKGVSPNVSSRGQSINSTLNWPTSMQGVSTDFFKIKDYDVVEGSFFTNEDERSIAKVCLLGQTVVTNLFPNGEDPIGKTIRFNKIPFKVIGTLSPKGNNTYGQDQDDIIIAPYTTVMKRITASTYLQSIYASAIDENSSDLASSEIGDILRDSHHLRANDVDNFQVFTQAQLITTFSSTSQLLSALLTAIAGISLVVGGIGIMNIMYVSVTERTKEIGLRMSLGASEKDILLQFLVEAILISITGGIIGIIIGMTTSKLVHYLLSWPTVITPFSVILSFVVCALTGIFFGYYPAQKASRLDPIEALHYE